MYFSEVEHLFPFSGCERSWRQCFTTESEIIWLDAGLRMDGIPALDLWDVVIEVICSSSH